MDFFIGLVVFIALMVMMDHFKGFRFDKFGMTFEIGNVDQKPKKLEGNESEIKQLSPNSEHPYRAIPAIFQPLKEEERFLVLVRVEGDKDWSVYTFADDLNDSRDLINQAEDPLGVEFRTYKLVPIEKSS